MFRRYGNVFLHWKSYENTTNKISPIDYLIDLGSLDIVFLIIL